MCLTSVFCFQTAFIQLVREVEENFVHESDRLQENENGASKQLEVSPLVWLILLRASEHFYKSKNRHPGTNGVPCHIDAGDLSGRVKLLLDHTKVGFKSWNRFIYFRMLVWSLT